MSAKRKLLSVLILIVVCAPMSLGAVRWRAHLIALELTGRIPDLDLRHLFRYLLPGPDQRWLEPLVASRNPYAVIRNTRNSDADLRAGAALFASKCGECHGSDAGGGPRGPSLASGAFRHGESDWSIYRSIYYGLPGTLMTPHALPETQVWQIVAFLRARHATPTPVEHDWHVNVGYDEIAGVSETDEDWLTFSGSYSSWRHSKLNELTPANVHNIALRWVHQFEGAAGLEVSPLVKSGIMYVTVSPDRVVALDAASGKTLWSYRHPLPRGFAAVSELPSLPIANRGVALLGEKVFFGTVDSKVVALNANTGALIWSTTVADPAVYYIDSAPLALRDLVLTGAGTREGGQGFVVALDANTGKERWRFVVIPRRGEKGGDTWAGDSARNGGGPTWMSGSYDPKLDLVYWGVGNPKPDYEASRRSGDNLYTESIVALQGASGKLVWHFQFTPGDDHDWDATEIPLLADLGTPPRKSVFVANRNGFFYELDRASGAYRQAVPFVHQTWAAGMDPAGRPIPSSGIKRTAEGFTLYPGNSGATNWWPPSYDSALGLIFVPVLEQKMVYFDGRGSYPMAVPGDSFYTAIRALRLSTGEMVWEHKHTPRLQNNITGGMLSTSGGIVFGGDDSSFFSLDSRTGAQLWSVEIGANINAAPITYGVNGEQFVCIAAGGDLLTFALPQSK